MPSAALILTQATLAQPRSKARGESRAAAPRRARRRIRLEQIRHLSDGRSQLEQQHHVDAVEVAHGGGVHRHDVGRHDDLVAADERARRDPDARRYHHRESGVALELIEGASHLVGVLVGVAAPPPIAPPRTDGHADGPHSPEMRAILRHDGVRSPARARRRSRAHAGASTVSVNGGVHRHRRQPRGRQRLLHAGGRQRIDERRRVADQQPVVTRVLACAIGRGVPPRWTGHE